MNDATTLEDSPTTRSEYDARGGSEADLASLPAAVRAIVEECRAQSKQTPTTAAAAAAAAEGAGGDAAEEAMPYPCRMYEEAVPGQEDMLQLQWMRVDMSSMDSERCWGQTSQNEEHDCGPDSGLVLPMVYRLDPAELLSLTPIGLPPELQRYRQGSSTSSCGFDDRAPEEEPEDGLVKLGRNLTEALASDLESRKREGGLPPEVVAEVASLTGSDWSICLERYVDLRRCDPTMVAQVLLAAPPPTLDCLLGTVLPAVVTKISSRDTAEADPNAREMTERCSASSSRGNNNDNKKSCNASSSRKNGGGESAAGTMGAGRNSQRDLAAVYAICNLAASVAASASTGGGRGLERTDPVQFREKLSGCELRKLGPLGREAEVALAEAFFYGKATGGMF